jgi:hypothetical protein
MGMTNTQTETQTHRARWYGVAYDREARQSYRTPRTSHMNDADWGWDAVCSCGYDTRTGGAIAVRVREMLAEHRWDVKNDWFEWDGYEYAGRIIND